MNSNLTFLIEHENLIQQWISLYSFHSHKVHISHWIHEQLILIQLAKIINIFAYKICVKRELNTDTNACDRYLSTQFIFPNKQTLKIRILTDSIHSDSTLSSFILCILIFFCVCAVCKYDTKLPMSFRRVSVVFFYLYCTVCISQYFRLLT